MNKRNLEKYMEQGVTIVDPDSTWISVDTEIGQDTIIYPSTYIEGKNIIGKNCKIGPCAHLRGYVVICDNIKIGNFVEVKKAKINSNTNVGHLSYIGDSELGERVNIGAGTITANYNAITKKKEPASLSVLLNNFTLKNQLTPHASRHLDSINNNTNCRCSSLIPISKHIWHIAITKNRRKGTLSPDMTKYK
jgi:bifunctional UDP-N-acetylglucosamine pyrophosphorylase/glucosamine-1-phosphate N-acetyltransferase